MAYRVAGVRADTATTDRAPAPDVTDAAEGATAPAGLRAELVAVWLAAAALFALTLSSVPALTHDALVYLADIEAGGHRLFHAHHLSYGVLAAAWLRGARALGVDADPLHVVALLNAAGGATVAALVQALLRVRAGASRATALAAVAGATLSFGVWFYSVSVEVYVLPLAVLLAATYMLTAPRLTTTRVAAVGVLSGVAVVGHEVHVLYAAAAVAVLLRDRTTFWRRLVVYGTTAAAVVVAAYAAVLAFAVRPGSARDAADWLGGYATGGDYWEPPGAGTVPSAALGAGRSVVGGHFMFRLSAVRERAEAAFPDKSLDDEAFLVRRVPAPVAAALGLAAVAAVVALAWVLVAGWRHRAELAPPARRMLAPLVTLIAAYGLFHLLWEPSNVEFWIPQATAAWIVAGVVATTPSPGGRRRTRALAAAAAVVGAVNLAGTIVPARSEGNDIYAHRFASLAPLVGRGDIVVVDRAHLSLGYTRRHTDARPLAAEPLGAPFAVAGVTRVAARTLASGRAVVIDGRVLDDPSSEESEAVGEALADAYGDRWREVETAPGITWLVVDP